MNLGKILLNNEEFFGKLSWWDNILHEMHYYYQKWLISRSGLSIAIVIILKMRKRWDQEYWP